MVKMKSKLYQKKNNFFQSKEWFSFQESYGREIVSFGSCSGISLSLPLKKEFIWIQKGPSKNADIKELIEKAKKTEAVFLRIEPENMDEKEAKKYGFKKVTGKTLLSGQKSPKKTLVLDISNEEEEILSQMKQKARYNIRLSERKGVKVEKTDDADTLYELLAKTAMRDKGYAPHERKYYKEMIKSLPENTQIFVAKKDGESLAAVLVSFYGEVATYLHGGFSEKHRNLMAPYLCQWEAIREARNRGCKYYDFWGIAETDSEDDPWAGITRFKKGFGGEEVSFAGSYDLILSNFWYNTLLKGAKVKRMYQK